MYFLLIVAVVLIVLCETILKNIFVITTVVIMPKSSCHGVRKCFASAATTFLRTTRIINNNRIETSIIHR